MTTTTTKPTLNPWALEQAREKYHKAMAEVARVYREWTWKDKARLDGRLREHEAKVKERRAALEAELMAEREQIQAVFNDATSGPRAEYEKREREIGDVFDRERDAAGWVSK